MRITADTNILVRVIMQDDLPQARVALGVLERADAVVLPLPCLCEFAWVLERTYGLSRAQIAASLRGIILRGNVETDTVGRRMRAPNPRVRGDFADGAIASAGVRMGADSFISFDRKAVSRLNESAFQPKLAASSAMTTFTPTSAAEVLRLTVALGRVGGSAARNHRARLQARDRPAGADRARHRPCRKRTGITLYEPEELVLSARAGTPLAEIEALLAEHRQELAFEPMDYGPLLGGEAGRGTIGGTLMANLSGPRRIKAGVRRAGDQGVLGSSCRIGAREGVSSQAGARGQECDGLRSPPRGLPASWGTLAVATDATFKVAASGRDRDDGRCPRPDRGNRRLRYGRGDGFQRAEVSGAAHLPESVTGKVISRRAEGPGHDPAPGRGVRSVGRLPRGKPQEPALGARAPSTRFPAKPSRLLWREIRDCRPFSTVQGKPLWRVCRGLRHMVMPWGMACGMRNGGRCLLRLAGGAQSGFRWRGRSWRRAAAQPACARMGGGHATLGSGRPPSVRAALPVFQPQPAALAALSARLKEAVRPARAYSIRAAWLAELQQKLRRDT